MKKTRWIQVVTSIMVSLFVQEVYPMRVLVPKVSRYSDSKGTVTLEIPNPQSGKKPKLTVMANHGNHPGKKEKTYHWKDVSVPSTVLISPQSERIVLLGAFGDPGMGLGKVMIYSFSGEILKRVDLQRQLPDLEKLSGTFGDKGNFPWIADATLSEDGLIVFINICGKKIVRLLLTDFSVQISDV